jgi:hypothetical protein
MKHLTFKKGQSHTYEAIFVFKGDTYLFGIEGGYGHSCGYWGYNIYRNGYIIQMDGFNYSSKRTWVQASNVFVDNLINQ